MIDFQSQAIETIIFTNKYTLFIQKCLCWFTPIWGMGLCEEIPKTHTVLVHTMMGRSYQLTNTRSIRPLPLFPYSVETQVETTQIVFCFLDCTSHIPRIQNEDRENKMGKKNAFSQSGVLYVQVITAIAAISAQLDNKRRNGFILQITMFAQVNGTAAQLLQSAITFYAKHCFNCAF